MYSHLKIKKHHEKLEILTIMTDKQKYSSAIILEIFTQVSLNYYMSEVNF